MKSTVVLSLLMACTAVQAADIYTIDPSHTYPSFEADHMRLSLWRGKFNKSSGNITLDRIAKTGSMDIIINMSSIDFGNEQLNDDVQSEEILDTEHFPIATYHGTAIRFKDDQPIAVDGQLTLHGVTRALQLVIHKFSCNQHPVFRREVCGADASAIFNRADFGINFGLPRFAPEVKLAIQVEAIKN
jgi:polyisoprenoid-binding protein YceI